MRRLFAALMITGAVVAAGFLPAQSAWAGSTNAGGTGCSPDTTITVVRNDDSGQTGGGPYDFGFVQNGSVLVWWMHPPYRMVGVEVTTEAGTESTLGERQQDGPYLYIAPGGLAITQVKFCTLADRPTAAVMPTAPPEGVGRAPGPDHGVSKPTVLEWIAIGLAVAGVVAVVFSLVASRHTRP